MYDNNKNFTNMKKLHTLKQWIFNVFYLCLPFRNGFSRNVKQKERRKLRL